MANTNEKLGKARATDEDEVERGSIVGAVPQSARTADETNADDPVAGSGAAREERNPQSASGVPADDEDDGAARRKAYEKGATLVSRID
ncbi:MAG TPA: hypothetical protein VFJ02_18405 [Vicinamibacterales bacterium]|nr:hypothetical protein [Vicinamibacterales bacterium]